MALLQNSKYDFRIDTSIRKNENKIFDVNANLLYKNNKTKYYKNNIDLTSFTIREIMLCCHYWIGEYKRILLVKSFLLLLVCFSSISVPTFALICFCFFCQLIANLWYELWNRVHCILFPSFFLFKIMVWTKIKGRGCCNGFKKVIMKSCRPFHILKAW